MEVITSALAAQTIRKLIVDKEREELWCFAVGPSCKVISSEMIFCGTVDACFVHPRDIFRFAIKNNASGIIIGHNHPSQECTPSIADLNLTNNLRKAGDLLQIPLLDHVIVTENQFFSFADRYWKKSAFFRRRSLVL